MAKMTKIINSGALVVYRGTSEPIKPDVEQCALLHVNEVLPDDELACSPVSLGGQVMWHIPITVLSDEVSLAIANIAFLSVQTRRTG